MAESGSEERALFDHIVAEFGDRGRDAVAFLQTAQRLLNNDVSLELPRHASAAAYCIREALKRLLPPESSRRRSWRKSSDDVIKAKKRLDAIHALSEADEEAALQDLLNAVAGLEDFKRDELGQHQRRLAELMESRAGTPPLSASLRQYQQLLRELDTEAVHASTSSEHVRELFGRALAVLKMVFGPFQLRRPELDSLAQLNDPHDNDVERLLSLCSTPHHVSYFMQRAVTPRWLPILAPHRILDPPQGGGVWSVLILIERLAQTHAAEMAAWLDDMYPSWANDETGAAYMAGAACLCLPAASATLLRALHDYPASNWIRSRAIRGIKAVESSSSLVEAAAETLLDQRHQSRAGGFTEEATGALVDGMTHENASARIHLLVRKLSTSPEAEYLMLSATRFGRVEQVADGGHSETEALLKGLIQAVRRARQIGVPTGQVLALFEPIPGALLARLRAWVLTEATDVSDQMRVTEIAEAVTKRSPTGDDVRLIQLITSGATNDLQLESWKEAMGAPPTPEQVGKALAAHEVPVQWQRARFWHPLLGDHVRGEWDTVVALMSPALPAPSRSDYLETQSGVELESARSPMTKSELEDLDVVDAARKISSWRPVGDRMTLARELGRVLEEVVASKPRAWAERPLEMLALLRHATYVHHYFEGLIKTSGALVGLGPQLVEAVAFARTHPWDIVRLGNDDFDYDPNWANADESGVALIGRLAERDLDLGDRYDEAWHVVLEAARDRSRDSFITRHVDPLETAINRPCTRALGSMFLLLGEEFRRRAAIRKDAFDLLDEALEFDGWNGAEHRAIIVLRLPFLLNIAPEWVASRESKLFGNTAPDGLGQRSIELALKWGRPNGWLLERYRRSVLRAVRAGSENALDQVLVAMLWKVPGYSIQETFGSLAPIGAVVISNAGESLARLLMRDADREHIELGARFWEKAIEDRSLPGQAYRGFGWWAEVDGLDREQWESMMLATCDRAEGSLDLCVETAERSVLEPITPVGLAIVTKLLRGRHEPWDRSRVAELALKALQTSNATSTLFEARERLRVALTDLGYFGAADL
jgi:hypothetical protein